MRFRRTRSLLVSGVVLAVICLQHIYRRSCSADTSAQKMSLEHGYPMQKGEHHLRSATLKPTYTTTLDTQQRGQISPVELLKDVYLPLSRGRQKQDKPTIFINEIIRQNNKVQKVQLDQIIQTRWPFRQNFRPNYFLSENEASPRNRTSDEVIIYMHHNKAAGSTTKDCLGKVAFSTNRHLGPVQDSMGRLNVHNLIGRFPDFKRDHNLFMGGYAFGLCDEFNTSCSYFTILREPYERTISSYSYCRRARADQLCAALSAGKVSLREWALHQGSFLFRQLLFDPIFCRHFYDHTKYSNISRIPHEFVRSKIGFNGAPCWFRQKVVFEHAFDSQDMNKLLQFALQNLENWFTVIGLVQEYDLSLAMLQEAYGLPFHSRCSGQKINVSDYKNMQSNTTETKVNTTGARSGMVDDKIKELMDDPEVRQALDADVKLYQRAMEIFDQQKQIFFKNLERRG